MDKSRDEAVRRLLAEARHDEPMPAEVVARLDRVLADLGKEPARVRPVTDLATRRRRVTRILLAAAAVVVVGVGVQQVVTPQSADDSAGSSTSAERETADHAPADAGAEAGSAESPHDAAESSENGTFSTSPQSDRGSLTELTSSDFSDDVTRVRDGEEYAERSTTATLKGSLLLAYDAVGRACRAGTWGKGTFVPVLYDGSPAVLVFRRALGETQVADLFLCGVTEPVRSVTLPAH